ncbi:MAG: terminase gpA endonuclease subunit [Candidatus Thorarchaeota archaeon]|jgi:phage terminase large subunit GpA-like protein
MSPKNQAFSDSESHEWLPPAEETIVEWAEANLFLPKIVTSRPGLIDLSLTPYIREPLLAATDNDVEEVTICCSTQTMKTTYLMVVALHTIAQDPWNMMHVMVSDDDSEDLSVERYHPIIEASPCFQRFLSGAKHDLTRSAIRLNGCVLNFTGACSPGSLASRPVAKLFLDEVDKYPPWTGREADPIKLARERTRTFWNRLVVNASTPTTAERYIWPNLMESTNERFWVPCPHCGTFQILIFGGRDGAGLKFPSKEDPEIIQHSMLAYYECEACSQPIGEDSKAAMIKQGVWCPEGCEVIDGEVIGEKPPRRHVGYHLWAIYSPWLSFSEITAEFLRSRKKASTMMNFRNSWQAEPWETTVAKLDGDRIKECIGEYYSDTVASDDALVLTVGVDVQSMGGLTYTYYVIRAWASGGRSWLVKAGIAESWDVTYQILFGSEYKTKSGHVVPIRMVLIDSGYRTSEVYEFCEQTGCCASKGVSAGRPVKHLRITQVETKPGSGIEIPLIHVDTNYFKTKLHRFIKDRFDEGLPKWQIPMDLEAGYFDHMTAEQRVKDYDKKTGRSFERWKVLTEGAPNHYFDCEVLAMVGAEYLEVWALKPQSGSETKKREPIVVKQQVFS